MLRLILEHDEGNANHIQLVNLIRLTILLTVGFGALDYLAPS